MPHIDIGCVVAPCPIPEYVIYTIFILLTLIVILLLKLLQASKK